MSDELTEIYPVQSSDDSPTTVLLVLPNDFDGEMDPATIADAVNGSHVMIDLGGGSVTFHVLENVTDIVGDGEAPPAGQDPIDGEAPIGSDSTSVPTHP